MQVCFLCAPPQLVDSPDAQDVVALDGGAVAHEEHAALLLRHEQVRRLLAGHRAKIPAAKK